MDVKIILGLDPGIVNTGWAILKASGQNIVGLISGTIKTTTDNSLPKRIAYIANEISKIIDIYQPSCAAVEEIFINKNPRSSIKLSHARGALLAACAQKSLNISEFSPTQVKKTVTGVGRADKAQINYMIKLLIKNAAPKTEHESDAYAVGYTAIISPLA